ncbi:MAG: hypothetical protein AMXMBFR13_38890 [Phycisphaerae bacterium]
MDTKEEQPRVVQPEPVKERPQRADYTFKSADVSNGARLPVEVYQFAEALRIWREQSSQSSLLVR